MTGNGTYKKCNAPLCRVSVGTSNVELDCESWRIEVYEGEAKGWQDSKIPTQHGSFKVEGDECKEREERSDVAFLEVITLTPLYIGCMPGSVGLCLR